ncbi:hypothetical protein [Rubrivivax rivuli]|uniref:Uncharacterized protein n=1 Tax=Rubrivivax rivuli TaxID=1862385 RepID=A0A437RAM7_9BURK|nr:hypothetical protein [Rubrivivax rivuli]RVU43762.1 hypothetical protein EOE66_18985 [Rubrivivax rivuli]
MFGMLHMAGEVNGVLKAGSDPTLMHSKTSVPQECNGLGGSAGDVTHAVLCAAAYNLQLTLTRLRVLR